MDSRIQQLFDVTPARDLRPLLVVVQTPPQLMPLRNFLPVRTRPFGRNPHALPGALAWMLLVLLACAAGCMSRRATESANPPPSGKPQAALQNKLSTADPAVKGAPPMENRVYTKPADPEIKKHLTPMQYEVTQHDATEPAFQNQFWNNHEPGLYVDIVTGEPLFSSIDKFESGTGWPSFSRPVDSMRVVAHTDTTYGMRRTEVRSKDGDSHLGHVFEDGPAPTGLRYCINSASLRFIPVSRLETEGYAAYRALFEAKGAKSAPAPASTDNACARPEPGQKAGCETTLETAVLAGGCFWGMEELLRKIPGVLETEVGYAGGTTKNPNYEDVSTGRTGHAEAVRIVFDPQKLTFDDLLEKWFFRMHDPTTKNRQEHDVGTQYRSAIFVTSPEQRAAAERVKTRVGTSGKWKNPIVTEIVEAGTFTPAEEYHQKYLIKHPDGYSCHYLRD